MANNTYHPKLSTIVNASAIPGDLKVIEQAAQTGINDILGNLRYTNYIVEHSPDGDTVFYSLTILGKELELPVFGTGMYLVFFRGAIDNYSNFPVTLDWRWPIQRYFPSFEQQGFAYTPKAFGEILLSMADIESEEALIEGIVDVFLSDGLVPYENVLDEVEDSFTTLRDNWNANANVQGKLQNILTQVKVITAHIKTRKNNGDNLIDIAKTFNSDPVFTGAITTIQTEFEALETLADVDVDIYKVFLDAVLLDSIDLNEKFNRLFELFSTWLGNISKEDVEDLLVPHFGFELQGVNMALDFPRKWVVPMKEDGGVWIENNDPLSADSDDLPKASFIFTAGGVGYHTRTGFEINIADIEGELPRCSIPDIKLQLELIEIKLDISRKKNISEAIVDDRPEDFIGVYVQEANIFLPPDWFKFDKDKSTLKIFALDLLIGTGGVSGIMGIEAVAGGAQPLGTGGTLLKTDTTPERSFTIAEVTVPDPTPDNVNNTKTYDKVQIEREDAEKGRYVIKSGGAIFVGEDSKLEKFAPTDGAISYEFGKGEKKWEIGFNKFYLKMRQNRVLNSEIKGFIVIPKFKQFFPESNQWATEELKVNLELFFENDGDFSMTASPEDGLCLGIKDVFYICVATLSIGKEDDKSYIEVSGSLNFDNNKLLKKYLDEPIEFEKLRIYSDGSFEIEGGSIPIPAAVQMKLGPVEVNITNITMGSEDINPSYKFIGFDCGISTGPAGIDARGDGIQILFRELDDGKIDMFLRIAGIGIDIMIPGTATEDTAALILSGYLSIRKDKYIGAISFKMPKAKIAGGAAMEMQPKVPAFKIDAFLEMATPIPLGPTGLGIYAFRGLFGLRYIADLPEGATSDPKKMFEFYTEKKENPLVGGAEQRGLHLGKLVTPDEREAELKASGTPISIGAGLSLGTAADNGNAFSMMAFLFLSMPEMLMISGKANVMSERVSLISEEEPPFFGYLALTKEFISIGLGADYKIQKGTGEFLELDVEAQLAFFFKDPSAWYIHFGTDTNPNRAVLIKKLFKLNASAYVMLSASGIKAGAEVRFDFSKKYGPARVSVKAYARVYGMVSFRKPQVGGGIAFGGSIDVNAFGVGLYFGLNAYLMMTVPKPFMIRGGIEVCVAIKLLFVKFEKCFNVSFSWTFNRSSDITPIHVIETEINGVNPASALHIGSGRTYEIGTPLVINGTPPSEPPSNIAIPNNRIPIDSYIDIQLKKPVLPDGVDNIGGYTNTARGNTEHVSPKSVTGQVSHSFKMTGVKLWVNKPNTNSWEEYHTYKALDDNELADVDIGDLDDLKIGYWQKKGKEYNNLRLLATTPFSYMDGMSGEVIPEQMGITSATLFCEEEARKEHCIQFIQIGKVFKTNRWTAYKNVLFRTSKKPANIVISPNDYPFLPERTEALCFDNHSKLEIIFPEAVSECSLTLVSRVASIQVSYFAYVTESSEETEEDGNTITVIEARYESIKTEIIRPSVTNGIELTYKEHEKPIKKIVIQIPCTDEAEIIDLKNQLLLLEEELLYRAVDFKQKEITQLQISEVGRDLESKRSICCPIVALNDNNELGKSAPIGRQAAAKIDSKPSSDTTRLEEVQNSNVKPNSTYYVNTYQIGTEAGSVPLSHFAIHPQFGKVMIGSTPRGGYFARIDSGGQPIQAFEYCLPEGRLYFSKVAFFNGNAGEVCIAGFVIADGRNRTIYLLKVGLNGELKQVRRVQNERIRYITNLHVLPNNHIAITGWYLKSPQGKQDRPYFIQFNSQLEHLISKVYYTASNSDDQLGGSYIDSEGILLYGTTHRNYDIFYIKVDFNGNILNAFRYNLTKSIDLKDIFFGTRIVGNKRYPVVLGNEQLNPLELPLYSPFTIQTEENTIATAMTFLSQDEMLLLVSGNDNKSYLYKLQKEGESFRMMYRKSIDVPNTLLYDIMEYDSDIYLFGNVREEGNKYTPILIKTTDEFDHCKSQEESLQALQGLSYSKNDISPSVASVECNFSSPTLERKELKINHTKICSKIVQKPILRDCKSYLLNVCYLTEEDRIYNQNIPSQADIERDFELMNEAVNKVIAPVWHPEAIYAVQVDTVEEINEDTETRTYYFPFATGKPIGHFELKNLPEKVRQEYNIKDNGEIEEPLNLEAADNPKPYTADEPRPADYDFKKVDIPETSLKHYLDAVRCYPDPLGNIINRKPMYYGSPDVLLFFNQTYVKHFFSDWPSKYGLTAKSGLLDVVIKDPTDNMKAEEKVAILTADEKPKTTSEWKEDKRESSENPGTFEYTYPIAHKSITTLNSLIKIGKMSCELSITEDAPLNPKAKQPEITVEQLLPSKLYNVLVYNKYNGSDKQIHSYPFQSSCYASLEDHICSYIQRDERDQENIKERGAIFDITLDDSLSFSQILKIACDQDGTTQQERDLVRIHTDVYQRIIEGYLDIKDLASAVCTEVNFLKNTNGDVLGIWVRTLEPINDPRITYEDMFDKMVEISVNGSILAKSKAYGTNIENTSDYMMVYSSDRSCVLILPGKILTSVTAMELQFSYLLWNGVAFEVKETAKLSIKETDSGIYEPVLATNTTHDD